MPHRGGLFAAPPEESPKLDERVLSIELARVGPSGAGLLTRCTRTPDPRLLHLRRAGASARRLVPIRVAV